MLAAAQGRADAVALPELEQGRKESHWMCFIFPQMLGLGHSMMCHLYGIEDRDEVRRYLAHPVLGSRLVAYVHAVLAHGDQSAEAIFGTFDASNLQSSATLFAADGSAAFDEILDTFSTASPIPRRNSVCVSPN
ncbi:DUF1810 domain-containing protein (plasmid) [Paracoccus liaowanqingii]|uniref:DUF1810 domain-containing protein n=1 Tax=Paracoccus liaowanqingii TaxID=2560053 RepID=A0A4Y5STQ4_9RHOB|nr:DUF1810 family protein [Paracoccus liaowanqingii]QDA36912.1 DUF1810 domain-containing protein [Paracoccus liaowanqingii]